MEDKVTVILTDESGWQKHVDLPEGVYWVGSAVNAHLRLPDSQGISPYCMQVVNTTGETSLRLINLSPAEIQYKKGEEVRSLLPGNILDVFGDETFVIGSYRLDFTIDKKFIPKEVVREEKQHFMGARLLLSDVVLRPGNPLIGTLLLQNLGNEACQFSVDIEGFPPECYEISPPPLIYGGGEESMEISFYHRKISPPAGSSMMTLRVSAAEIYPGQEIAIQQTIKVVQHYEQVLAFGEIAPLQVPAVEKQPDGGGSLDGAVKDVSHKDAGETQKASITQPIIPDGSSPTESIQVTSEDVIVPEVKSQEEKVATGAKIQEPVADVVKDSGDNILKKPKRPDLSSIKVMKANTGEFLEKRIDQE